MREGFKRKGVDDETAEYLLNSLAEDSLGAYSSTLKRWAAFCKSRGVSPFRAKVKYLLQFLLKRAKEGLSYSSLNVARSAVSLISTQDVGKDPLVGRFLKATFRARPLKPKYESIYNIDPLLEYIVKSFPLNELDLPQLTEKLTILLALGTAQRVQTLSLMKLSNLERSANGYRIVFTDMLKTTRPDSLAHELFLPCIKENKELCIACTLEKYLRVTKNVRNKCDNLLLTTRPPFHAATRQSIARWIKATLAKSGVGHQYSAHSTRHAAASAAKRKGVNVNAINKVVGWSSNAKTFCKFYNRPLESRDAEIASTVLSQS